ncbi:ferredoxin [Candidatus Micrarchaeota archaeon]|nr:ferredoxin [Candidatus Micrarchaeota archaeon]MBU1930560.1 ferredoxin [Candidatus Micrarchaeota archaeon]
MSYKIEHDKPNCIGCAACVAVAPDFWEMENDKSHLKESKPMGEGEQREIEEKDKQVNIDAAQSCPVNVIHVKDKAGKELV